MDFMTKAARVFCRFLNAHKPLASIYLQLFVVFFIALPITLEGDRARALLLKDACEDGIKIGRGELLKRLSVVF
jgi:hypothetical protein